jgi:ABC-type multidrug transport system ATPase subunit/pSer/pThr/pTyr-binding forkhead associated (FHA) protein/ABC-type multidrug transport system permease subunit
MDSNDRPEDDADVAITLRSRAAPRDDDVEVALRGAALLFEGRRVAIPAGGLTIGRSPDCDLQLMSGLVSPAHARVDVNGQHPWLTDLGSTTGTYLNGERFAGGRRPLNAGDAIAIGEEILRFVTSREARLAPVTLPAASHERRTLRVDRTRLRIGSAACNDVVLEHPTVSPAHAEIVTTHNGSQLRDLSSGGVGVRLNGELVSRAFLRTGDEVAVGPFRLVFDGEALFGRQSLQGLRLDCEGVSYAAGERTILHPTWLRVQPGELVAVIGESGAGKSTLLKCLAGVQRPAAGRVTVNGEPLEARLAEVGYVPQDEIVHKALTVEEALRFAAELRLPQDAGDAERNAAIARAIEEVGLADRAGVLVGSLSGGQRKRVGVATELVNRPGLLFLDEPTTGLDAGLELRMMELLRQLADAGLGVALVTHATKNLRLCDKVVVMGRGGVLCYSGPYDGALEFFGVDEPDDIYATLDATDPLVWNSRHYASPATREEWLSRPTPNAPPPAPPPLRPLGPQIGTLTRRYARVFARDRRNLIVIGAQVPLLGLATGLLYRKGVFDTGVPPDLLRAGESAQLLFLLTTICIWFGAIAASREIVKERTVLTRELAIGVRPGAYLASKLLLLGAVTGTQAVLFALLVFALRPLDEPADVTRTVVVLLIATAWAAVAMGLLVSAFAASEDQASSYIPLILVPQLLFGGAIVPVEQMGQPVKALSGLVFAQWSFAGVGHTVDLNARIAADPVFSQASRYGPDFFGRSALVALVVLALFAGAFLFAVVKQISRRPGGS